MLRAEKKRSFVRRHSSRGKRTRQSSGPDSPRLDRHPSLRFSTTRLPSGRLPARPLSTAKTCTLSVTQTTPTAAKDTPETTVNRKESSGSNASSIGTCHDLGPSVSAYSVGRGCSTLHPEGNRSSSSADTAAVEGPRDELGQKYPADNDQGLLVNRAMDVSHINLLRTGPSEQELSGSRRRIEDGLEVQPSSTVDRLSPASCRRQPKSTDDGSNQRRDTQLDSRQADATVSETEGSRDLVLIGISVLVLLVLTSPTMIFELVAAVCSGRRGWYGRFVGVQVALSLRVVAYVGALVRPVIYYAFSSTLRQSLITRLRCRPASS